MPKVIASREYRSMNPLAVLQRSQDDEAAYRAEGYATTFDVPYILFEMDGVKYYEQISSMPLIALMCLTWFSDLTIPGMCTRARKTER